MNRLVFVIVTMAVVSSYCWLAGRLLPPLQDEPLSFLLLPMTVISGVTAALFHPLLNRQRSRSDRARWLYVSFLVSLVLYGLYLWRVIPDGSAGLIVLALVAGHFYGLPAVLAVLVLSVVAERRLFPGPRPDAIRFHP